MSRNCFHSQKKKCAILRYLLGVFILFSGFFLLPSAFIEYESNHNFIFNSLFGKVTYWRFHSPQMFIIYDYVLLKLYAGVGFVNWYLLLNLALLCLAYTAFYFTINQRISLLWFLIYTSIFFLYSSVFLLNVHIAYLLCICGVFLNYNSIDISNIRRRNLMLGFSIAIYFLGFFLRWEIGTLTIFLYSIFLIFDFNRRKIFASLPLIIPAYLSVISINLFFATSNHFEYRTEPDGEFLFLDGGYKPAQMNSLEDTIRFEMLTSWLVDDTVILSFNDMLKALDVARKPNLAYLNTNDFLQSLKGMCSNFKHLTVMIILCCIVLFLELNFKKSLLIFPILASLFIRTSVVEERHLWGVFLFLFLLIFSTRFHKTFFQRLLTGLIFLVSIEYIYEKQKVQREIRVEKDIVMSTMKDIVKSGKRLYISRLYPDIFPDRLTFNSNIFGFSSDSIVLLSLHQASHTVFFAEYLSKYCDKDLLNIGNIYSCVAQDRSNVLISSESTISVIEKIVNKYYSLDIRFKKLRVLYGNSDSKYHFKHCRETLYLYHLEFD